MPKTAYQAVVDAPTEKLFRTVLDVESYPRLLRFIRSVEVLERQEDTITARVSVGVPGLAFSYDCRIVCEPDRHIRITQLSGPFEYLKAEWEFVPVDACATRVRYALDSHFRNPLLEATAGVVLARQIRESVQVFEAAVKRL